ncbi:MAG: dihydrofolate reductase [Puniceicoccales bacterium]|jgi:dihydrofolate reductase|nr:dihydrofolate reductase [Puniceicoccales bacterium]
MTFLPPRPLTAIAAMADNRAIGCGNKIPWHIPEDFKFFKQTTMGGVLVMGRHTYESIGRPLPGRVTVVLSRQTLEIPGVRVIHGWEDLWSVEPDKTLFLAGGAQLYEQALPWCGTLYLTRVHQTPGGDAFFPHFESLFDNGEVLANSPGFTITRYNRLSSC